MHMTDCRGASPLSYVRKEHWGFWIEFLENKKDIFWPKRDLANEGEQEAPALAMLGASTQPLTTPSNALTLELADMVVSGKMQPEEAKFLQYDQGDGDTCDSSDDGSEYDSDDGSDNSGSSFDADEMVGILSNLSMQTDNPAD